MSTSFDTPSTTAFDRGISPVLSILSPGQIKELLEYRGDQQLQKRIEELAGKSDEGTLTTAEQAEYEGYVRANKFVATLQAQARKINTSNAPQ